MLVANSPVLTLYSVKTFLSLNPADRPYYYCGLESHNVNGPRLFATFFVFTYVSPLTIIATMYLLILRFLHNRRRQSTIDRSTSSIRRSHRSTTANIGRRGATTSDWCGSETGGAVVMSRQQRRTSYTTRVFLTVVIVFGLCWLPLHANLLYVMFSHQPTSRSYAVWRVVCHTLAYANSSVNPFIYHYVSADFRRSFNSMATSLLARCRRALSSSSTVVATTASERRQRGGSSAHSEGYDVYRLTAADPAAASAVRAALCTTQMETITPTIEFLTQSRSTNVRMCQLQRRPNESFDDNDSSNMDRSI